ncbi:MAG: ATP-binding protein [Microcystis sp. M53603_WE2]|jgi:signal transduction histidine kinase|uniref:histidine kinase n=1 Tax=Microcystis aeruginosa PCC 9717 TaxID=1160286 RepID=I4FL29_MICAE|nr:MULTISPECIES: ATP-binding protein [Microcystis]MCZ8362263.1 ATP-binding protein [Microcystis sp. LE19-251.1A]MCZ8025381.1 ATP-binding protein [Microcystis sp. LE19-10.1B]MDJ0538418.1 ATP-binding protein [Microcystis sp. M53603_WE2]MDJ0607315.1 ATP-binding protein [Microcystis sp. M53602_WE12]CCH96354.1 Genome sequencing data, contig C315 [Microcystis aeruginosa PCC 9717]
MNWLKQGKWIAGGFGLTVLLMGTISLVSYRNTLALRQRAAEVEVTYEIIDNLANLYANMAVAESGRRGYITTGSPRELSRHRRAIALMQSNWQLLAKQLENGTDFEREMVTEIGDLMYRRITLFNQSIATYKSDRSDDISQDAITVKSVEVRDKFQNLLTYLQASQKRNLRSSIASSRDSISENSLLGLMGTFISFGIICGVYFLIFWQEKRRQKSDEIHRLLLQEKELSDLKIQLFSMISHEFRTPLTVILSASQLLENGLKDAEQSSRKNLYRIQSSVKLMNQFLTDILILTRAESGNLSCRLEPLDIEAFCLNLVEDFQFINKNNTPIKFVSQGLMIRPYLDEKLLYSILSNLLLNAIKYSPTGAGISLILWKDSDRIVFQVRDHGIGIAEEDRGKIYEPFYRGQNVENIIGTGLGLAVVKKCVELHRGEIALDSQVDKGTSFTVKLPISP